MIAGMFGFREEEFFEAEEGEREDVTVSFAPPAAAAAPPAQPPAGEPPAASN
jgi:hypothetical protein